MVTTAAAEPETLTSPALPWLPTPRVLAVACPYCGSPVRRHCVTTPGGARAEQPHADRFSVAKWAHRLGQSWYVLRTDDPRFGLEAGDILRCVDYPYDAKVTVLFREHDGFDPECNQYLSDVQFLGFVPADMEVPTR